MVPGSQLEQECSLQGNSLTPHRRFPAQHPRGYRGPGLLRPGSVSSHPEANLSVADVSVHPAASPLSLAACLLVPLPLLYNVSPHLHYFSVVIAIPGACELEPYPPTSLLFLPPCGHIKGRLTASESLYGSSTWPFPRALCSTSDWGLGRVHTLAGCVMPAANTGYLVVDP